MFGQRTGRAHRHTHVHTVTHTPTPTFLTNSKTKMVHAPCNALLRCTGGFSIEKTFKGHPPEPPTLVVMWMETLSRDITWLRSDALKNHNRGWII